MKQKTFEIREPDRTEMYSVTVMTKKFFPYTNLGFAQVVERARRDVRYLVARADRQTIGYADYSLGEPAKIWGLAVLEEWRRKGVGKTLLARALEEIRKSGARRVEMLTTSDNAAALRLYEKFGFRCAGPYEKTLPGKEVIIMAKEFR